MKKKLTAVILIATGILGVIAYFIWHKDIRLTPALAERYELHGIDVSHYQGDIDWKKLEEQKTDFAFIKATEGSSYVDECFYRNWKDAQQTDICVGAYHFFSFDSPGEMQAALYIETVGDLSGKIAPVIDIEYYGDKDRNPPDKEDVTRELGKMLLDLEKQYQIKPIIYTTYKAYYDYIKDGFEEYPLWIRNVYYRPVMIDWSFWQYTDSAVLEGYQGTEKYIDQNVFRGTREELKKMSVI